MFKRLIIGVLFLLLSHASGAKETYNPSFNEILVSNWTKSANNLFDKGDYKNAIAQYFQALYFAERFHVASSIPELHHHLATCYSNLGDFKTAQKLGEKALKLLRRNPAENQQTLSETYNLLGSVMVAPEEYKRAKYYFQQALQLQRSLKDFREIGNIYLNFGCLEMEHSHFQAAEDCFNKGLDFFQQAKDAKGISVVNINLAVLLVNRSETEDIEWREGIDLANKAREAVSGIKASDFHLRIHELKALFYKELGKYDSSLYHSDKFHEIKDSLYNIEHMREVANWKSDYEIQKKQLAINRLSLSRKKAFEQVSNLKWGLVLVAIVLFLLFFIFRYRQIKLVLNQQKKEREQELRFLQNQMNPHFLFNALTSAQAMVVKGNKIEAADFLAEFSKLIRKGLYLNQKEKVTLLDEVDFLKTLVEMEEMRNNFKVDFQITGNYEDLADELLIPPMILQPFIENSLLHGLPYVEQPFLHITINCEKTKLIVVISNNFNPSKKTSIGRKSLGIELTKKRVELLNSSHKKEFTVSVQSSASLFRVEISLPIENID